MKTNLPPIGLFDRWLTTADIIQLFDVRERTVERWRGRGMPCIFTGRYYYKGSEVIEWMRYYKIEKRRKGSIVPAMVISVSKVVKKAPKTVATIRNGVKKVPKVVGAIPKVVKKVPKTMATIPKGALKVSKVGATTPKVVKKVQKTVATIPKVALKVPASSLKNGVKKKINRKIR